MRMAATRPRIVLGGTSSGAGKTTLTVGLMAALAKRGMTVQGFKVGPDYIDPTFHTAATGRISRNLDTWMMEPTSMKEIFWRASEGADISLIEGVMGFYDGKDPKSNRGSTAEIGMLLDAPVILVVDIKAMARSAAAIVKGFQLLEPAVNIAGVIANRAGSANHFQLVKTAIEQECGVPVIGYLPHDPAITAPERHLGLVPAVERGELQPWLDLLAEKVAATVDLDQLLALTDQHASFDKPEPLLFKKRENASQEPVTIAVARDSAFHFYYQENFELLEAHGAKLHFFSPLAGELPPADADGLYIGGGFPEEFAARLEAQADVRHALKSMIEGGLPTFAECGGYMFLCEAIHDRAGNRHEMLGIVKNEVKMQTKLAALGYREAVALTDSILLAAGETARGHEFHYSSLVHELARDHAYEVSGLRGRKKEGFAQGNVLAGYTHLHFASNPGMVQRWLTHCREWKRTREERATV
ncbi:cobyrinate a,c-diamide synthase [Brevibacillus fluminis]|uniref:cobyrinate a,c-diamide synthase n=1 Tax=Brevibacillus fluminis TaxID=511487 RepID=UPI003F8CBF2D